MGESTILRITTAVENGTLVIAIAGRLTADGCDAVDRIVTDAQDRSQPVQIDLAGIRLVDRPSVEYLARIRRRQVALIHLPCYVSRWVDASDQVHSTVSGTRPGRTGV